MSYTTIAAAAADAHLQERVTSAVAREAWNNPALGDTIFGTEARQYPVGAMGQIIWPVAVDTEAAYESAVIGDNPDPGGDPAVVTDGAILAAVQAHWPPDPV